MLDQAQGLRALAEKVSHDRSDPGAAPTFDVTEFQSSFSRSAFELDSETPHAGLHGQVLVADARMHMPRTRPIPRPAGRSLAITSGKGGVGKSCFSANLSITLGQLGHRVIVMDAHMGLANVHLLLGASPPFGLGDVMHGRKSLAEVLHSAGENVQLIAGSSGTTELANLSTDTREAFLTGLRELDTNCDLIVIDTGAGLAHNVLAFLCAVNEVILIATPEPTAIMDAYATIKVVSQENPGARLMLVANMVHSSGEGMAVAEKLKSITRQFLNRELEYLGCIPTDHAVQKAVRQRTPFVCSAPGSAATAGIHQIIRKLGYRHSDPSPPVGVEGFVNRMQRFFRIHGAV